MELANTTKSVRGSTKRGIVVQARTASPSNWGAFTLFLYDDARCGSKPARWRCRVFFTKERMHHEIPEGPARRDRTRMPPICPNEPTEKYGCIIPRNSARPRNARNSWQHFEHSRAITGAGRYEEEALHKAGVGTNRPLVQRWIIRMRIIMTAANCSPTVASRRAKHNDDFQVPTLLGAQPLEQIARASPARHAQCRHDNRTWGGRKASVRTPAARPPSARRDAQANHHA
jgi:hypothetical protein